MSPRPSPSRILVMLSGGGRTALNLLDAIDTHTLNARIVHAIASKPCAGADRLEARGVSVQILPGEVPRDTLVSICNHHNAGLVALCGYLRYVHVPERLAGRILNIHPSLLPKFGGKGSYGHRVHEAVIAARETISGCTVHEVDNEFDHGPIILQKSCPVLPNDTPETLAARVFDLECVAYPEALQLVIDRLVPNSDTSPHDPTMR
ncbi:MAG: phosphoribosylglycinamide formyltransferase [Phycisphaeraceae bacterium]|nr:phosphoribosylglycinamide formyltransferase [Phycisphaeraceae bacterium]